MLPACPARLLAFVSPTDRPFEPSQRWLEGKWVDWPRPDVLLLEEDEFGHAMLYRYTSSGEFGGDTWHESLEQGKRQAVFQYGEDSVSDWEVIPDSEADSLAFAIRVAAHKRGCSKDADHSS